MKKVAVFIIVALVNCLHLPVDSGIQESILSITVFVPSMVLS